MRYAILFIYIAVSILLFVFNWGVFTTILDFDLGFGSFSTLPFFVLQLFGGILIGGFIFIDRIKDLKQEVKISSLQKKIVELQKDAEIVALKKTPVSRSLTNTDDIGEMTLQA